MSRSVNLDTTKNSSPPQRIKTSAYRIAELIRAATCTSNAFSLLMSESVIDQFEVIDVNQIKDQVAVLIVVARRIETKSLLHVFVNHGRQKTSIANTSQYIRYRSFVQFLVGARKFCIQCVLLYGPQCAYKDDHGQRQSQSILSNPCRGVTDEHGPRGKQGKTRSGHDGESCYPGVGPLQKISVEVHSGSGLLPKQRHPGK